MQTDALLAHHDRADIGLGGGLDDRVDRIADQKLDPLALQDFGDGIGDLHEVSSWVFSGGDAIVTQPVSRCDRGEGGTASQAVERSIAAATSSGLSSSARWPAPGIVVISVRPVMAAAKRSA